MFRNTNGRIEFGRITSRRPAAAGILCLAAPHRVAGRPRPGQRETVNKFSIRTRDQTRPMPAFSRYGGRRPLVIISGGIDLSVGSIIRAGQGTTAMVLRGAALDGPGESRPAGLAFIGSPALRHRQRLMVSASGSTPHHHARDDVDSAGDRVRGATRRARAAAALTDDRQGRWDRGVVYPGRRGVIAVTVADRYICSGR